jgi:hypothetical protein
MTNDITLSVSNDGLILLYKGSPLCDYKQSIDDIWLVAKMFKMKDLPDVAWNSDRSEWVVTNTIEV